MPCIHAPIERTAGRFPSDSLHKQNCSAIPGLQSSLRSKLPCAPIVALFSARQRESQHRAAQPADDVGQLRDVVLDEDGVPQLTAQIEDGD